MVVDCSGRLFCIGNINLADANGGDGIIEGLGMNLIPCGFAHCDGECGCSTASESVSRAVIDNASADTRSAVFHFLAEGEGHFVEVPCNVDYWSAPVAKTVDDSFKLVIFVLNARCSNLYAVPVALFCIRSEDDYSHKEKFYENCVYRTFVLLTKG